MSTNIDLCHAIRDHPEILGIPHSKCDCQAAVEKALRLVGVNVNFKGSNDMWRNMVYDRYTIDEYKRAHDNQLTPGLICFTLRNDGSEKNRGYYDNMGAATHVGIILDTETCFQSASRGTEIISLNQTSFNRVAYCNFLTYVNDTEEGNLSQIQRSIEISGAIDKLNEVIEMLKGLI